MVKEMCIRDSDGVGGEGVVGAVQRNGLAGCDGGGDGGCFLIGGLLLQRGEFLTGIVGRGEVEGEVGGLGLDGAGGDGDLDLGWGGGDDERAGDLNRLALDGVPDLGGLVGGAVLQDELLIVDGEGSEVGGAGNGLGDIVGRGGRGLDAGEEAVGRVQVARCGSGGGGEWVVSVIGAMELLVAVLGQGRVLGLHIVRRIRGHA